MLGIQITLLEPGFFSTNVRANAIEMAPHPAYARHPLLSIMRLAVDNGGILYGDPKNAVAAMYRLVSLPDPPLHFPLGEDAIVLVRRKTARLLAETNEFEKWSEGLERHECDVHDRAKL